MHSDIYASDEKDKWRELIRNTLTADNCHSLIDENGNFTHKWLEPIGAGAIPFEQLIQSGKIREEQLIGIDLDPSNKQRSIENVQACKLKFPKAEFNAADWASYCRRCHHDDIGYFILDLYTSTFGDAFRENLIATLKLIDRCKKNIGECLLIINCDLGISKRFSDGSVGSFAKEIEACLKHSSIESIRETKIDPNTAYVYSGEKTKMVTFIIKL